MENKRWEEHAAQALFYVALGKLAAQYMNHLPSDTIKNAMHDKAVSLVAKLYAILQNKQYDDPECMEQIESILMVYAHHLDLDSFRHIEQD